MNWLAHALLSPDDAEVRLGNLLADVVKGRDRKGMSARFREGIRRHQAIDTFTDFHAVVGRSKRLISPRFGRFAGVLVDIFYDHFLARRWESYCGVPLAEFTAGVYASLRGYAAELPPFGREVAEHMIRDDRLTSYRAVAGIESALARLSVRISERIGRTIHLEAATQDLVDHYEAMDADFAEFFPELAQMAGAWEEPVTTVA